MSKLIKCPTCGNDVSENAPTCPRCGEIIKEKRNGNFNMEDPVHCIGAIIAIFFLILVLLSKLS